MNKTISDIDKFHQTRKGKLAFGTAELVIAALAFSRAIYTGSLWEYLIGLLMLIGGLNNLVRAVLPSKVKSDAKSKAKKR